jgi:heavy metal sensor kinase
MTRAPRSVRTRLTLWYAGVLALIVCVFSTGIFLFVRARLSQDVDAQLERALSTVERVAREEPGELRDLDPHWGIALFQVADHATVTYRTDGWARAGLEQAVKNGHGTGPWSWTSPGRRPYRVLTMAGSPHDIAVAVDETPFRRTLRTLAVILIMGVPCAVGLAIVGGYVLAGRVLSPVGAMADTARKITAESLGERLPVQNPEDEFGRLATVFNDTLSRLDDSFARLRRFTADASHELRTPLTAMRSVGEVALQRSLDRVAYRDVIGSMLEEVDRLTRLVESLLTLTRADAGRTRLALGEVELGGLAATVADSLRVLAEEKAQTLTLEAPVPVTVTCDPSILRQALINLIDNAIKYTPDKGLVTVLVAKTSAGEAQIDVRDSGPGIAAQHRERIFDRFYRVDAGRARDAGGLGLGLAITRWAVEAHGGRIELESEQGQGSLFRIVLPPTRG